MKDRSIATSRTFRFFVGCVVVIVVLTILAGIVPVHVPRNAPHSADPVLLTSPPFYRHHVKNVANAVSSLQSSGMTTQAGDSIWCFVAISTASSQTVTGVQDSNLNNLVQKGVATQSTSVAVYAFVEDNVVGTTGLKFTESNSAATNVVLMCVDFDTQNPNPSLDVIGSASTNAGSLTASASCTTTIDEDVVFLAVGTGASPTITASGGDVLLDTGAAGASNIISGADLYENQTTHGAITLSAALSTSHPWAALALGIRPPPIPAAPTGLALGTVTATTIALTWTNPNTQGFALSNDTIYEFASSTCTGGPAASFSTGGSATTGTATGLSSATTYGFKVAAWNISGSTPSSCLSGQTLPAAPTSLAVTGTTTTSVSLSWTNPSGTLTDDKLHHLANSASCSSGTATTDIGSVVTSYTKTGLASNTYYCMYVVAVDSAGVSAASNIITVVTNTVPAAPTALAVTSTTVSSISLSWSLPSGGGLNGSTIYYAQGQCGTSYTATVSIAGGSTTTGTVSGLTTDKVYDFAVTSWNATGQSAQSSCVSGVTATVPAAPTSLLVVSTTTTTASLSWTNPSGGGLLNVTLWQWSSGTCAGTYSVSYSETVVTSATVTALTSATTYSFKVSAWNATGNSPLSGCVAATTLAAAPTGLAALYTGVANITIGWTNPPGTLTTDYVYWAVGTSCVSATQVVLASPSTTYTLAGLSQNTTYCFYVEAVTAGGPSAPSATITASIVPVPNGLVVTSLAQTSIGIMWRNWGLVSNLTIYYGTSCAAPFTPLSTGSEINAWTFARLSPGTKYCIYIEAWNGSTYSVARPYVNGTTSASGFPPTSGGSGTANFPPSTRNNTTIPSFDGISVIDYAFVTVGVGVVLVAIGLASRAGPARNRRRKRRRNYG